MIIQNLSVNNIRSHNNYELDFSPDVTIITGKNGSGKTSLLESIYISLQGTSFKGSDNNILKKDQLWWKINSQFNNNERLITFNSENLNNRKKINIDGKQFYRMPAKYKVPLVLFEPDNLRLLNGAPNRRRDFIDKFISQFDNLYSINLHKYERALKQRNNLLKDQKTTNEDLFIWDVALSEYGADLINKRIEVIEQINQKISDYYNSISQTKDLISIHYSTTYIDNIKQKLLNNLQKNYPKDRILGYTTTGPHRHDVIFNINNSPAIEVASRGEIRTIILALKFIEINLIKKITGDQPIVLLDDVFSELDESRQKFLINNRESQIIITTTNINKKSLYGVNYIEVNL